MDARIGTEKCNRCSVRASVHGKSTFIEPSRPGVSTPAQLYSYVVRYTAVPSHPVRPLSMGRTRGRRGCGGWMNWLGWHWQPGMHAWHCPGRPADAAGLVRSGAGGGVRFRVAARIPHSIRRPRPSDQQRHACAGVVMTQRHGDRSPSSYNYKSNSSSRLCQSPSDAHQRTTILLPATTFFLHFFSYRLCLLLNFFAK